MSVSDIGYDTGIVACRYVKGWCTSYPFEPNTQLVLLIYAIVTQETGLAGSLPMLLVISRTTLSSTERKGELLVCI